MPGTDCRVGLPAGVGIRRLTRTESTPRPGLQGPRHWLRASPDGTVIAFLDEDEKGIVQIFGTSPNGGEPRPLSRLRQSVDTPFTWSPDGRFLATSAGGRIVRITAATGASKFLTPPAPPGCHPRHGVVFSPDGKHLAYNRLLPHPDGGDFLQICLVLGEHGELLDRRHADVENLRLRVLVDQFLVEVLSFRSRFEMKGWCSGFGTCVYLDWQILLNPW